jgi:hypothetical protein
VPTPLLKRACPVVGFADLFVQGILRRLRIRQPGPGAGTGCGAEKRLNLAGESP